MNWKHRSQNRRWPDQLEFIKQKHYQREESCPDTVLWRLAQVPFLNIEQKSDQCMTVKIHQMAKNQTETGVVWRLKTLWSQSRSGIMPVSSSLTEKALNSLDTGTRPQEDIALAHFSCSVMSDSLQPRGLQYARFPRLSPTHGVYSNSHRVADVIQPSHPLLFPSPPAFNLSQHQSLFQSDSSSHQVAKVLQFPL